MLAIIFVYWANILNEACDKWIYVILMRKLFVLYLENKWSILPAPVHMRNNRYGNAVSKWNGNRIIEFNNYWRCWVPLQFQLDINLGWIRIEYQLEQYIFLSSQWLIWSSRYREGSVALCPTSVVLTRQERTAQILRATHFYALYLPGIS